MISTIIGFGNEVIKSCGDVFEERKINEPLILYLTHSLSPGFTFILEHGSFYLSFYSYLLTKYKALNSYKICYTTIQLYNSKERSKYLSTELCFDNGVCSRKFQEAQNRNLLPS